MCTRFSRTVLGLATMLTFPTAVMAADPLGQLKSENEVEVISNGVSTVVTNDVLPIFNGDMIKTRSGSSALIRFTGDVGFVQASEEAAVSIGKDADKFLIDVDQGQTQFMFQDQQDFVVSVECLGIERSDGDVENNQLTGGFVTLNENGTGSIRANDTHALTVSTAANSAQLAPDEEQNIDINACDGGLASVMGAGASSTGVPATVGVSTSSGAVGVTTAAVVTTTTSTGAVITTAAAVGGAIIAAGTANSNEDAPATPPADDGTPPPAPPAGDASDDDTPPSRPRPPVRPIGPPASPVLP